MNVNKVDVVICVKNNGSKLEKIIHQVRKEVPVNKLIIIYATSNDNTEEVAKKYADEAYFDNDKGLGAARNLGMRMCTTDVVAMIDSDVILTENWYTKLINLFDKGVAAVMGTCLYGYGNPVLEYMYKSAFEKMEESWGCFGTLFDRKIILDLGNFNKDIKGAAEDYELYFRIKEAGFKWVWVKEVLVLHPRSIEEDKEHRKWWAEGQQEVDKLINSRKKSKQD